MILRALVLAFVLLAPSLAAGDSAKERVAGEDEQLYRCKKSAGEVVVSFKPEIEIRELVTWASGFTCKEFIFDPRIVARKLTIVAPNKMTPPEAYRMFLVALQSANYTVVPKGPNLLVVTEAPAAKRLSVPFYKDGLPHANDEIVRFVYRPTYAQAESLIQAFTAVKSDSGELQLVGTILLATDYASHIKDMLTLAKLIDVPKGADGVYLLPVRHADAKLLSDEIAQILGMQASAAPAPAAKPGDVKPPAAAAAVPSKIIVDQRTNTLIVAASEAGYKRVEALVERLDVALEVEGGTTFHVYRLGSSVADELAKTLNEAIQGSPNRATAPKPGAPPAPPAIDPLASAIEGQVRIIGDKPTNSLLVMSSGRDYLAIKDVIKQLDIPRRQVYIEALILEVAVGNGLDFGTSSHAAIPGTDGSVGVVGAQLGDVKTTKLDTLAGAGGLVAGLIGRQLANTTLLGTSFPSYGLLFQALATDASTNIVSAPSFIGVDNKEAKQKVGIDIPYERGTFQAIGTSGQQTTFDRKPLLLELAITPHISIDDTVLLEVKHEANDLSRQTARGPEWSTRSLETSVVVRNQQTVVIGGMMQEKERLTTNKIPLLGDIPLLGHLFKFTKKDKTKTNLIIMLTPYIIKDQMDLQRIHDRKMREQREFTRSFHALEGAKYVAKVDYSRKRGVLEEINRTLIGVEEDAAARDAFRGPAQVQPGAIEYRDAQ